MIYKVHGSRNSVWSSLLPLSTNLDISRVAIFCSSPLTASLHSLATDLRFYDFLLRLHLSTKHSEEKHSPHWQLSSLLSGSPIRFLWHSTLCTNPSEKFCPPLALDCWSSPLQLLLPSILFSAISFRLCTVSWKSVHLHSLHHCVQAEPTTCNLWLSSKL